MLIGSLFCFLKARVTCALLRIRMDPADVADMTDLL